MLLDTLMGKPLARFSRFVDDQMPGNQAEQNLVDEVREVINEV